MYFQDKTGFQAISKRYFKDVNFNDYRFEKAILAVFSNTIFVWWNLAKFKIEKIEILLIMLLIQKKLTNLFFI